MAIEDFETAMTLDEVLRRAPEACPVSIRVPACPLEVVGIIEYVHRAKRVGHARVCDAAAQVGLARLAERIDLSDRREDTASRLADLEMSAFAADRRLAGIQFTVFRRGGRDFTAHVSENTAARINDLVFDLRATRGAIFVGLSVGGLATCAVLSDLQRSVASPAFEQFLQALSLS